MIFLQKKFIQFFETTHKKWRKANYILNSRRKKQIENKTYNI